MPTKQASDASFDHGNPVLAAYHNHAYALSVRVNDSSNLMTVYFSTDESGHWTTHLMTNQGPSNSFSGQFTSLAVDASTGRLYAIWAYHEESSDYTIGVWTRDPGGQWTGPTAVYTGGALGGQPSIVAQNGKAYAAFISGTPPDACPEGLNRVAQVQVVAYDGSSWSAPQNPTSCVSHPGLNVENAKLAIDENGRPYLAYVDNFENGDLWYSENATGSWSDPVQVTHGAKIGIGGGTRPYYGIAASNGTAYVTYARLSGPHASDILLMTHPLGGSWSAPVQVSPHDAYRCPRYGVSIVANAGRVGLSFVRGGSGQCQSEPRISGSTPFVYTGAPGHMAAVGSLEGAQPDCFSTSLAKEGNLFRFVTTCQHAKSIGKGQLYYKAELLDTVGPVSQLFAPASAKAPAISVHWSARDPQPGSGVSSYQLQVRDGSGSWHPLLASTHATKLTYRQARIGHQYTFRLRAKDRTANWGAWVAASTRTG